jgi:hypothetical protein
MNNSAILNIFEQFGHPEYFLHHCDNCDFNDPPANPEIPIVRTLYDHITYPDRFDRSVMILTKLTVSILTILAIHETLTILTKHDRSLPF